jgi:hypothetical protein
MESSSLHVSVGESWITVCNGMWHLIFLEKEQPGLPGGPCRGENNRRIEDRVRHIESILDDDQSG